MYNGQNARFNTHAGGYAHDDVGDAAALSPKELLAGESVLQSLCADCAEQRDGKKRYAVSNLGILESQVCLDQTNGFAP